MGDLLGERVVPGRQFLGVGIDFMGPIEIHYKIRDKRPTKVLLSISLNFFENMFSGQNFD